MHATVFHPNGNWEQLHEEIFPDPIPTPDEIIIDVRACGVNRIDLTILRGHPRWMVTKPHALGADVSGVVSAFGENVRGFKTGDRVIVSPGISCMACEQCRAGKDLFCPDFEFLGSKRWGGYAEKIAVPSPAVLPISQQLTFEIAAAFPIAFLTAWHMCVSRAKIQSGMQILVIGGSGAVGSAAMQIVRHLGARVMTTTTSPEKIEALRSLGAEAVVDSSRDSIAHVVRAWTQKRGVDVVIDTVGQATWPAAIGSLAPGGTLVTCGTLSGVEAKLDLGYLTSRELSVLGSHLGSRAEFSSVLGLIESGALKPSVGATLPRARASEALRLLEEGRTVGKIILVP